MDCPFDCERFRRYSVELPYPQVTIIKPNRRYAAIISGAFGSKGSEMTAITQYGIHRLFLQGYPEAFDAYKYIASVEMTHWQLLGGLIRDLGLEPRFLSYETNCYWNGSFPAYRRAYHEILEADVEGEYAAIEHYTRMIGLIDNEEIRSLFRRIILDEEKHIEILTGLYCGNQ